MQNNLKVRLDFEYPGWRDHLTLDGDNREFVVNCVLPMMHLDNDIRQVIRWAYGFDGEQKSHEHWSDGSSLVRNKFFDGLAKDPHGVGHDYLHLLSHHSLADPHRHTWGFRDAADWYYRASKQFGDGPKTAFLRRLGLDFVAWPLWGPRTRKYKPTGHPAR